MVEKSARLILENGGGSQIKYNDDNGWNKIGADGGRYGRVKR